MNFSGVDCVLIETQIPISKKNYVLTQSKIQPKLLGGGGRDRNK